MIRIFRSAVHQQSLDQVRSVGKTKLEVKDDRGWFHSDTESCHWDVEVSAKNLSVSAAAIGMMAVHRWLLG